ncbi:uncharacterized protein LOC111877202 [Lactuca sativa]|uniref:uncharacterized protein LOC111877202 n=1 Tax=Lactuca sativa TaxID=4236 RepID=UPI000CD8366D|nr:uncharacterized protein LOC111877202 [Lactuca sativa]
MGTLKESFSKLPVYFHNLKKHNPGTVAYIKTGLEDRFDHRFFAIGCEVRAFRECCRKVIIMDGAHLKGKYKGTILHEVAMDGNNQILPIGYGICPKETTNSWTWFLEELHECIGDVEGLTIVTDRAPTIALIRAYKTIEFEFYWGRLRNIRDDIATYLTQIPCEKWTRAYFPTMRNDFTNEKSTTILTKWAEDMVKKNKEGIQRWSVSGVDNTTYQVHDFKSGGIVNLREKTCSCRYWQLTGFPCGHVIMVLLHLKNDHYGHMAIDAYKIETYRRTYKQAIYPLSDLSDWEVPDDLIVVNPPVMEIHQAGRPKNTNRIPS